jgi:hypothetical protein
VVKADDEALKRIAHLTNLTHLSFDATKVTNEGLKALAPLKRLSVLEFWDKPLTVEGIKALAPLKSLTVVTMDKEIDDDVLRALVETGLLHVFPRAFDTNQERAATQNDVRVLDLTSTKVTTAGLKYLAPVKSLSRVYLLRTTDESLRALREAGLLHTLELAWAKDDELPKSEADVVRVVIRGQKITDAGLKELAALKNLRLLTLQYTEVTDAGVAELQKALPNCKIER